MSRRDGDLLQEILEAASHIAQLPARGRESFDRDVTLQYATGHGLVLIGEAAGRLSPGLRERHPDVPWRQIVGQRNVVVHEYDRIDLEIVWNVRSTKFRDSPSASDPSSTPSSSPRPARPRHRSRPTDLNRLTHWHQSMRGGPTRLLPLLRAREAAGA